MLLALQRATFEPLESVKLSGLSLKKALLTTLTSLLSGSKACLESGPAYTHVVLKPQPCYVPKVPTTHFKDQVVNLQVLPHVEADPALSLLFPVQAKCIHLDLTERLDAQELLFVCFGRQQNREVVSKQRIAHWIVDTISWHIKSTTCLALWDCKHTPFLCPP